MRLLAPILASLLVASATTVHKYHIEHGTVHSFDCVLCRAAVHWLCRKGLSPASSRPHFQIIWLRCHLLSFLLISIGHVQNGGAVLASFIKLLNIAGTNFTQNSAQSADGGALSVTGDRQVPGTVRVDSCHFSQNTARTVNDSLTASVTLLSETLAECSCSEPSGHTACEHCELSFQ